MKRTLLVAVLLFTLVSTALAQQQNDIVTDGSVSPGQSLSLELNGTATAIIAIPTPNVLWSGIVLFEVSSIGLTDWTPATCIDLASGTIVSSTTTIGSFQCAVGGYQQVRARHSGGAGATAITIRGSVATNVVNTVPHGTTFVGTVNPIDVQGPLTDAELRASAVPVDGSGVTQPISAVALPLPSGASTSANQTTANASLSSIDGKLPALSGGRIPVVLPAGGGGLTDTELRASPVPMTEAATTDGTQKSQLVDAAGDTANVQGTSLDVRCTSGCVTGASFIDNTTFTVGADAINTIGGVRLDAPSDVANGDAAAGRITPKRALHVNLRDNSGNEVAPLTDTQIRATPLSVSGTVTTGGLTDAQLRATAVPVDGSGVTQPVSAAALPLPAGAATSAAQATGNGSLASIDGKLPAQIDSRVPITTGINVLQAVDVGADPMFPIVGLNPGAAWAPIEATDTTPNSDDVALIVRNIPSGTQAVSAASLPLPSGASTSANQTTEIANQTNGTQLSRITDGTDTAQVETTQKTSGAATGGLVTREAGQSYLATSAALTTNGQRFTVSTRHFNWANSAFTVVGAGGWDGSLTAVVSTDNGVTWLPLATGTPIYSAGNDSTFGAIFNDEIGNPYVISVPGGVTDYGLEVATTTTGNVTITAAANTLTNVVVARLPWGAVVTGNVNVGGTVNANIRDASGNFIAGSTSAPVGTENALIVRNIPSGIQQITGTVTGTVAVSGTVAATQSGTWNSRTQDGAGNAIASATTTPGGSDRGIVVRNIPSGTQTVSGTVSVVSAGVQQASGTLSVGGQFVDLPVGSAGNSACNFVLEGVNTGLSMHLDGVMANGDTVFVPWVRDNTGIELESAISVNGSYRADCAGFETLRILLDGIVSGSVDVTAQSMAGQIVVKGQPGDNETNLNRAAQRIGTYNFVFDGTTWDRWTGGVNLTAALPAGTNNIGDVDVLTLPNVAQATAANLNAEVQGDAASGAAKSGNPVQTGAVFNTTQPTVTNGQVVENQATARGGQIVATGVDTFNVTVNAALPAGTNAIGKLSANNGVDIGDVDVLSVTPGTGATNMGKAEDAAHTTGDVGSMQLAVRKDTNAQVTSADGDYTAVAADAYGVQYSSPDHPNRIKCYISSTATTSTVVTGCSAPGAGLSIYVTSLQWYSSIISTTANFMRIQSGTGGTCGTATTVLYDGYAATAFGGHEVVFNTPLKLTTVHELCFVHASAGTRLVSVQGFIAP